MADNKKPGYLSDENTPPEQLSAWERWQLPNMDRDMPIKGNALNIPGKPRPRTVAELEAEEPELKPLTAEDLEALRQAAYEEGLEQGREVGRAEGYDAGYLSGEGDVKAALTRLSQITRVLLEPIPQQDQELEQVLLHLVEQICKRVVHRELSLDSSAITTVVQEAIDSINPGHQRLRIHLNKQDLELVLNHLQESGEWEEGWRVLAHPTITPGGCIIETDNSMVDARAERRLASVIQQVYEQQQQALKERGQQHGHVDQLLDEVEAFAGDAQEDLPAVETPVTETSVTATPPTEDIPDDDGSEAKT
ncbi:flagellar assembly protein FliH [Ketobacter sp.]|uniref:flagellar assembly protein FliH n=1 Tax=Ketobacter sp. TaxID=2083498 RepID=UPI000F1D2DA0|nr:flagellar assembly protein FliH [Ketobacter sp.]RLT92565.1 MAG: flagellar assembly protein FliH [Ketobacter sp.]